MWKGGALLSKNGTRRGLWVLLPASHQGPVGNSLLKRDHLLLPPYSPASLVHLSLEWNLPASASSPSFICDLLIGCD